MRHQMTLGLGLVLLLCSLSSSAVAGTFYSSVVLSDSPLAYWNLGDAGPTAADLTGNGHAGTGDPGVSFGQTSLLPGDASDDSITMSGSDNVTVPGFEKFGGGATGYSVEFWMVFNAALGPFQNLVGDGEAGTDFYLMAYLLGSGQIRAHANGSGSTAFDSASALVQDQTYHIVTTWDQASGVANIYIDGALDNTAILGSGAPVHTDNIVYLGDDGREPGGPISLDEVAIYDYALSSGRVAAHHSSGLVPEPSPS